MIAPIVVCLALIVGGIAILIIERLSKRVTAAFGRGDDLADRARHRRHPVRVDDPRRQPLGRDDHGCADARRGSRDGGRIQLLPRRSRPCSGRPRSRSTRSRHELGDAHHRPAIAIGFVVSFIVALLVIRWFVAFVGKHGFAPFAWYRIIVGGAALGVAADLRPDTEPYNCDQRFNKRRTRSNKYGKIGQPSLPIWRISRDNRLVSGSPSSILRGGHAMADGNTLKFVDRAQAYPGKRPAKPRAEDFREIADRYAPIAAEEQACRCSQCGVPYCSVHCPLHNHIPDWLRLTAEGRLREAYELCNADLDHARDLRPHLPAGPAVRRQLRDRILRSRRGHHRLGREVHHRHRLGRGLGRAARAGARPRPSRSA